MPKKTVICLALVSLLALGGQAVAEIGTIDDVPAATLLLPYFEVDLNSTTGITTLFSINNASAAPALAHVTVWTDLSVPVLDFDIYLTGYDVQTINMRDIVNGLLPKTQTEPGEPGTSTPADPFSPNGDPTGTALGDPLDTAGVFTGTSGPCVGVYGPLSAAFVNGHLKPALTGKDSTISDCVGVDYGDNIARGYVTVDSAVRCSLDFPIAPSYFTGPDATAAFTNILWGDYFYVEPGDNFAQGETLVHIEACQPGNGYLGYVGNGAGYCPLGITDFTFYSRFDAAGFNQREGLASQFAVRYIQGGLFDGGTDYIVWRDSRSNDITGGTCPADRTALFPWYPMNQQLVVAFDEEENSEELCFLESDVSPPQGGLQTCFPIETGRYNVTVSAVPGSQSLAPTPDFGWMFLDLDLSSTQRSQAWVTAIMSAEGRFAVGFDAVQLDNVLEVPITP